MKENVPTRKTLGPTVADFNKNSRNERTIILMLNIPCNMHAVARLSHCATSRKVAGSIPDGDNGIFHWHNPSGRIMALGSTQPLEYQEHFLGVKAAGA